MNKLKHPGILKLSRKEERNTDTWLVVEPATPLEVALPSLTCEDLLAGIYDLSSTLCFIHDKVSLINVLKFLFCFRDFI